ncbi:uncharacterized protein LOC113093793 [Carassius auratus]|uniref:Uncharacterized protein LOC113093793 n=1 Tax=Carassius auratus TaxID=7957 RepID=A0A6P6P2Z9_CARAU|nr:uncharacterized protein LOC113093793 [Carassius auratus]
MELPCLAWFCVIWTTSSYASYFKLRPRLAVCRRTRLEYPEAGFYLRKSRKKLSAKEEQRGKGEKPWPQTQQVAAKSQPFSPVREQHQPDSSPSPVTREDSGSAAGDERHKSSEPQQPESSPYTVTSEDSGSAAGDERHESSEPQQPESSPYTVPSEDSGSAAGDERCKSSEPQQPESSPYTVPSEDSGSAAGDERRKSSEPQQPESSPYTVPSEDSGSAAGDERCESPGQDITGSNRFAKRCNAIISNAPLDKHGEVNMYQCKGLIDHLKKYVLPFAGLWTGIMLGDLGRHETGPQYKQCSRRYNALRKLTRQNITQDNKTLGVIEKSQWDLKHIRFTSGRLTRLDNFVAQYRISHTVLLKEYEDSERVF